MKNANSKIDANNKPNNILNREHNHSKKQLIQVNFEHSVLLAHRLEGCIIKTQGTAKKS